MFYDFSSTIFVVVYIISQIPPTLDVLSTSVVGVSQKTFTLSLPELLSTLIKNKPAVTLP